MAGFDNSVVYGDNADFSLAGSGGTAVNAGLRTDGQMWIGTTSVNVGGTHISIGTITSPLGTLSIGYSTPNITLDLSGGASAIESFTPNSGTSPVVPNGSGNITLQGTGSITTVGGTNSLSPQLTGLTNHAVLVGAGTATITKVGPTATAGQVLQSAGASADPAFSTATYPATTTINQILYSSSANTVTGLSTANNGVLTTGATGIPTVTTLTNGQLIIGSTAGAPIAASLTAGAGITITPGANSITIAVTAGSGVVETLTGNSGGAISPTTGNINTVGTGSITIAGSGSTLTAQLTGLTNHAIQIGAGTATLTQLAIGSTGQVLQANSAADPTWSTATYPSTTTVSQILYSSSTNVVSGLATANRAVLTTNSTGVPVATALATDGQLIIGSTAGAPAAATITAGTGITVTNASNSITISSSSSGFSWTDVTGAAQTIAAENGYITDRGGGVIYTLPVSASLGDTFIILGKAGLATITPLALQQLLIGSASGTVGITGTAVSTNAGDCITFVCTTSGASTVWRASSFVGNWTLN